MTRVLNLLQIGGSDQDAAWTARVLTEAGHDLRIESANTDEQMRTALKKQLWDLVMAGDGIPQFDTGAALAILRESGLDVACIVFTEKGDEADAERLMKAGAHDYLTKDRIGRLGPIVERELRALECRREGRLARQVLRDAEDRYRRITEAITDYIFSVRLEQGKVVDTQRGAGCVVVTGYTESELQADPDLWRKMVLPEDRVAVEASASRAVAGDPVPPIEYRIIRKDGVERWFRKTVSLCRNAQGSVSGYDGLVQDITERKRTEEALQESEEKFSRLFYLNPDLATLSRVADGVYLDISEGFTAITGYSREEIVGHASVPGDLGIWVNQEDRERLLACLKADGKVTGFEASFRCKDGSTRLGLMSARLIQIEGALCILAITRDISERTRIEDEFRKLSRAVEQSPVSIVITDLKGAIEYVNGGFTRVTGYTAEEARGLNPRILKGGDMAPSVYEELWRTISAGGEWHGEFLNKKKNGELYWEDATVSAIKDGAGRITHYLAIKEDITARKRAEGRTADALAFNRIMIESSPIGIITYNSAGDVVSANEAAARIVGTTIDEVKLQNFHRLDSWKQSGLCAMAELALATGFEQQLDTHTLSSFGRDIWLAARFVPFRFGGELHLLSIFMEVTERKHAEERRERTLELLDLCNRSANTKDLVRELTHFFQRITGCDAVGIRLREAPDLPYFETRGFSSEFVDAASRLCALDAKGELARDSEGHPVLECMCRDVLCGRFDPQKPFFTDHGSFWTNSTSEILAGTTEADRQARTRNRCIREGYESVALIPIRGSAGTIGLVQCSDRRKGRFTADQIAFLESQANYVAIALAKLDSEQALRSSEEHLRAVIENTEAGYFFIDTEGRFQRVNQAWLRLHGYERPEEIIGRHFSVTQIEPDLDKASAVVVELLAGVARTSSEFSRRKKDGSVGYHTFSAHTVRENGKPVGLEGFLIDTTGLRVVQEQYKTLFERMLDGFALHEMIFDAAGKPVDYRFLAVNPAFERMTGLKSVDVVGRCVREVLPGVEQKWIEVYGQVVRTGEPQRFEDFTQALGKHFEVLAFRPQAGEFACLIQDVSVRKQLEVQLMQAQKLEAIGQLAGGVAHDFNNILAATMMHLSLLQMEPGLTPQMRESLKELEGEARRGANLTRQLLMFSRRQEMRMRPVELNEVVGNLLNMLRRLIGEHIKLIFAKGEGPHWVEADAGMIDQVIMNLCVNARDAMPEGGQLKIDLRLVELEKHQVVHRVEARPGRFGCLTVSDSGVGMAPATLARIFEPFFTTKEVGKGTGLGLATVYGIVKHHRGWVEVESVLGLGTTFRIYLPELTGAAAAERAATTGEIPRGTETVLVVEDDPGMRRMVTGTLRILGYQVLEAANGKEAIALWEKHASQITVLFTDLVMPEGLSGLKLTERFRGQKPALRVIVTSGYNQELLALNRLQETGIAYLPKPYAAEKLAVVVRNCIDGR